MRVGYIENIIKVFATVALTKQGNAFTATVYPRFELFVPNINACTSRCVRSLGINQDLVLKRIFVLPRRTFQKSRPILIVGKAFADFVRQCRYILQLARHLHFTSNNLFCKYYLSSFSIGTYFVQVCPL